MVRRPISAQSHVHEYQHPHSIRMPLYTALRLPSPVLYVVYDCHAAAGAVICVYVLTGKPEFYTYAGWKSTAQRAGVCRSHGPLPVPV